MIHAPWPTSNTIFDSDRRKRPAAKPTTCWLIAITTAPAATPLRPSVIARRRETRSTKRSDERAANPHSSAIVSATPSWAIETSSPLAIVASTTGAKRYKRRGTGTANRDRGDVGTDRGRVGVVEQPAEHRATVAVPTSRPPPFPRRILRRLHCRKRQ